MSDSPETLDHVPAPLRPPPILSRAELAPWQATMHPAPAAVILPPAPEAPSLLDCVRFDLVATTRGAGCRASAHSTTLLARRSALGDAEAWDAVERDLSSRSGMYAAAAALGRGDVDRAVRVCAEVCGMDVEEWAAETRREMAAKAGAR